MIRSIKVGIFNLNIDSDIPVSGSPGLNEKEEVR